MKIVVREWYAALNVNVERGMPRILYVQGRIKATRCAFQIQMALLPALASPNAMENRPWISLM